MKKIYRQALKPQPKYIVMATAFIFAASALLIRTVQGQSAAPIGGLTVTPPTFELSGNPGQTITNTVRIENRNDHEVRLAVDRRNFTAIGEEGAVGLTEEETTFSLASWISVDPAEAVIPPKTTKQFKFTLNVPAGAEPGGHFGSLVFRTIPTDKLDGSGATLAQEISSLILVKIAGNTKEEATIESFAPEKQFSEYGPVILDIRAKNSGNVHVKPTGTVTITNLLGQKVATVAVDSKNILPGAIRRLEAKWDTKWRVGRYTATLVLVYGKDQVQRAAVTNFVVFPYKVAIAVGIVLLVVTIILIRSRKRLKLVFKILFTGKA